MGRGPGSIGKREHLEAGALGGEALSNGGGSIGASISFTPFSLCFATVLLYSFVIIRREWKHLEGGALVREHWEGGRVGRGGGLIIFNSFPSSSFLLPWHLYHLFFFIIIIIFIIFPSHLFFPITLMLSL